MKKIILTAFATIALVGSASAASLGVCTDGFGNPYPADGCAAYVANSAYVAANPSVDTTSPAYILRSIANDHQG